jgi:hypothetical protein
MADLKKEYEINVSLFDFVISGRLGQKDENGKFYFITFFSKKLKGPELNY